ncbi:MAG: DUF2079 domain-containing protein [Candidatus Promineifilaceae bacterium]|nr:DUF2079 domain-containing protein [Candidatus Promineifilaceae bacterium]
MSTIKRWTNNGRVEALLLLALLLLFIVAYSWLSIARHQRFNSTGYDLAINEQILWNTLNGRFFASSLEVGNSFADHFRPFLLVMLPLYALFQRAETLLTIQTIILASAAIPIYQLAILKLRDRLIAILISTCYLLYPAVGFIARFDFHIEVFAIPAFVAAFLAMERKQWAWATAWLLVPLLVKENMGLTVAMFGLYALLMRRDWRWALGWLALGLATFLTTTFWLLPAVRGENLDAFDRYHWLGSSPQEMLLALLTNPVRVWQHIATMQHLQYLRQLFLPAGFLALLGLPELILALPGLVTNLLADHFCQPTIYCQYTVPVVPFVFIALVTGLFRLDRWWRSRRGLRMLTAGLVLLTLISFWRDNPFADQPLLPPALHKLGNEDTVALALAEVAPRASVVTTNDYAPHLARREGLYILGVPAQRETPVDADVVFLNLYDQQFIDCDQIYEYLQELRPEDYGVIFRQEGVLVLQRGAGDNAQFQALMSRWNDCAG